MKYIRVRFEKETAKNPNTGSYFCFLKAVKGQSFSEKQIRVYFGKLVDKDDYSRSDRKSLIKQLTALSNMREDGQIEGKFPHRASQIVQSGKLVVCGKNLIVEG